LLSWMSTFDPSATASRESLRERTLAGVRWTALARICAEVATLASMVVLAHLIPPAEFGKAAIPLVIQAIALVLASEGLGSALVARRTVEQAHLECAALLALALGGAITGAVFLSAPLFGPLFGGDVPDLVRMLSPVFLLSGMSVVPLAVLQRRLDFRRTGLIEVAGVMARTGVSLGLAYASLDAAALTLGNVAAIAVTTALLLVAAPVPRPRWHARAGREIISFGLPAAGAGLAFSGFRNVDYAIVGAKLGVAQLGFYWRAYQLGVEYQRKISGIALRLALPVYSRAADLDDMRAIRTRFVRAHAVIVLPLLAAFIAVAEELVPWILGEAWRPAVVPAQILAVVGMLIAIQTSLGPLVLAAGKPRALLAYNVASVIVYAAVVLLAAPGGLTAVCLAVLAFHAVQFALAQWVLLKRLVGIPLRSLWTDAGPAAVSCLLLLAVTHLLATLLASNGVPVSLVVVTTVAVGGAVYLLTLRALFPPAWRDFTLLTQRMLPRGPRFRAAPPEAASAQAPGP
jgi:O-antigen/teichoic acid export membrane protein